MVKGIIFDLDGVICHTDHYHYVAWKALADSIGVQFDEQKNNRLRGVSRFECLEIILESADKSFTSVEKEQLAKEKNARYVKLLGNLTHEDLSAEVYGTLIELRKRGFLLAIGSGSKNAGTIIEHIGLEGFFDTVSDGNNITKSKPDPEVFLKAAGMIGLLPEECRVVEDAESGIDAAINGGFACAGIREASDHPGATYSITSFKQLLTLPVLGIKELM